MPLSTAFAAGCRFRPKPPYISMSVRPSTCELPKHAGSTTPGIHSPHRFDAGGVNHRLGLRAVILAIQVREAVFAVERAPHHRRAIPAHIHAVAARPVLRYIEARHKDLGLRQRID